MTGGDSISDRSWPRPSRYHEENIPARADFIPAQQQTMAFLRLTPYHTRNAKRDHRSPASMAAWSHELHSVVGRRRKHEPAWRFSDFTCYDIGFTYIRFLIPWNDISVPILLHRISGYTQPPRCFSLADHSFQLQSPNLLVYIHLGYHLSGPLSLMFASFYGALSGGSSIGEHFFKNGSNEY